MSTKKITIGGKPTAKSEPISADNWVDSRVLEEGPEPMKRLTIDISESLHRSIKSQCASRGTKIVDEVREMLMQKYGKA